MSHTGGRPQIDPQRSRAVAARFAPELAAADVVAITVDQTNVSQVVGGEVIVKWLLQPVPLPHPGVEVMRHLALVGFAEMPELLGVELVDGAVAAIAQRFLAGARDGWEWYVDLLIDELTTGDCAELSIAAAARLGGLAGRLHAALATPSEVFPTPTGSAPIDTELERGRRLLARALIVASPAVGERVRRHAPAVAAIVEQLGTVEAVAVQPIHGDLHVGQMLRRGDELVVTDFDGDPLAPDAADATGRWGRRSAMVDLAALVQSIDHVGRVAVKRRLELATAVDAFIAAGSTALLDSYAAVVPIDERLLSPLRVIQELHELVYAAEHLPRWEYVPDAALGALMATPPDHAGRDAARSAPRRSDEPTRRDREPDKPTR